MLYACDDRSTLALRFSADGNQAFVERPGQPTLMLPRQVSASGFVYETPQYTLRGKADQAIWTVGRRVPVQCRVSS